MHLGLINIIILYGVLFTQNPNDSDRIVEVIMNRFTESCLFEEKWTVNSNKTPSIIIESYKMWVFGRPENSLLTQNFKGFLSSEDADSMIISYTNVDWKSGNWDNDQFDTVMNFDECEKEKMLKLTDPIFNKNNDIAFVYLMIEGQYSSSFQIIGLKKDGNKWEYVSRIPKGIGHKLNH